MARLASSNACFAGDAVLIKQVMSRFQFPDHAIPGRLRPRPGTRWMRAIDTVYCAAWAKYIPEEAWLPKMKEESPAADGE